MPTVELIYDLDCPNVKNARAQLLRAFAETGFPPGWQEWNRGAPESPPRVRAYGSPTILVNGQDVADASPSAGADCCRLYVDDGGQLRGVPSVKAIAAALSQTRETMSSVAETAVVQKNRWLRTLAVLPVVGTALLPSLTCPTCWPAYAGLLSAFGLGFVNYTSYLLPLTAIFLIVAVASLRYRAKTHWSHTPFVVGLLGAILVITGKFVFVSDLALYGGIALLAGPSLWNFRSQRGTKRSTCPACVPKGTPSHLDMTTPITSARR